MNKKAVLSAAAISVLGAGIMTASTAFAQSNTTAQDPMSSLVQKIADKFHLNKDEVQAVFDEAHEERHTQMQADFEKQLSQYVSDGKITEQQKQLILEKRKAMEADRETNKDAFKNLSNDERKAQMDQKKTELDTWASENGIDLKYVMPHGGRGPGMGGPREFGSQERNTNTQTPTVTQ